MQKGRRLVELAVGISLLTVVLTAVLTATTVATTVSIGDGFSDPGGTTVVPLMIYDVTGVSGMSLNLTFDESVVTVVNLTDSDFEISPQDPPYDRGPGWVVIDAGQVIESPLNGDVKICDVKLQAKGVAGETSPLLLTEVELDDKDLNPLPVDSLRNGTFRINGPPKPRITSPADGAKISGTVTIEEVDDSGEGDIAYNLFEYYYDKNCNGLADDAGSSWTKIGNDTNGADGWSSLWDTRGLIGCYLVQATMGDNFGLTGTDRIQVVVPNHAPAPEITSPVDGVKLTGSVTIDEQDTSLDLGVDIVYNLFEYYYDENCNGLADDAGSSWTEIGNDTNGADGWSVNWNTALIHDCCYLIRATMGDNFGLTGTDTIRVVLSNHDPIPYITEPADGATLSGSVTIKDKDTSTDVGIDIVYSLFEYYYDENCNGLADDAGSCWTKIGNDTNGADGWSSLWDTRGSGLSDGCYLIRATMGDKHGRTGTDEISVNVENAPPVVTDEQATPNVIPDDTDDNPLWGETTNLTATVTDVSGVASVRIDLSQIGGSATQAMTNIGGNLWSVETNASAGTTPGTYLLPVNATDTYGNSNTTEKISLRVQKNGDVQPYDGNGVVDFMGDAIYLVRHTRNVPGYENIRDNIADVTGDGVVDFMGDAIYLVRHTRNVGGYEILK